MSDTDTSERTLWLMASQMLPEGVAWECEACGGQDVVVSLESRAVRLVCTSRKVIGVGIDLENLVASGRAECVHCAGPCRPLAPPGTPTAGSRGSRAAV